MADDNSVQALTARNYAFIFQDLLEYYKHALGGDDLQISLANFRKFPSQKSKFPSQKSKFPIDRRRQTM